MKLRARLILTLAVIAIVVAGPAVYALSRLTTLREIAAEQRTRHAFAFLQLGELQTSLAELDRYERGYIISGGPEQRAGMEQALLQSRTKLTQLRKLGYRDAGLAQTLTDLEQSTKRIVSLVEARRVQEASTYFESIKPLLTRAQNLNGVAAAIDDKSRDDILLAQRVSSSAVGTTLAALVICFLIALGFGIWNAARITTPIHQLQRTTSRVAEGDFAAPEDLPTERGDEIGDLSRSFSWMTQQLRKLDQMKAEFVSIATHELKTPINVIGGYAELIQEGIYGAPTPKQREALETIREQTRVLTNLVNQLLDISRLEAGGLKLEREEIVVRDLMSRVERSFSVLARKKDIDFRVDVDTSVPRTLWADADRLGDQVIGNLLSNALKFTPEGGRIRVRCWSQQDGVHIEVKDSGVGVAPDQLPFIFDKFYQIGQQARSKGAGLGLAIAREIMEAHGGTILAESQQGEGTTFCIVIPIRIVTRPEDETEEQLIEKTA
ncbi:MAG TPA: ATP-binding protein [Longimicrobiales bacterium]|nr:ATP-binding protein [Longimicrobiales bacterium]